MNNPPAHEGTALAAHLGGIQESGIPSRGENPASGTDEHREQFMRNVLCFDRAAVILLWLFPASPAHAQTDEIQVYDASIAAVGAFNLTLHDNYTLSGSKIPALPGGIATDRSLNGTAEWAYGVANWFMGARTHSVERPVTEERCPTLHMACDEYRESFRHRSGCGVNVHKP